MKRRSIATSLAIAICLPVGALSFGRLPLTSRTNHRTNHGRIRGASGSSRLHAASTDAPTTDIAEIEEVTAFASANGVDLQFTTNPARGYRGVAVAVDDPENILGYVEGFIRPAGQILHADKMEIFKAALNTARTSGGSFSGGGTFLGPGLLVAYVCLLHGRECGCSQVEFLAIDDAEFQHKRLVRYYRTAGFEEVRYVGEELKDIGDRLVWGGCGTLMTENVDKVLRKWTRIIRAGAKRVAESEKSERTD